MNIARAFAELEAGAELFCLHKNPWWQTSRGPLLDSGAFVAGLEYAAGVEATILGKPSPAFFGAALDTLDADPELTWMVGDDLEADIAGAKGCGLKHDPRPYGQVPGRDPRRGAGETRCGRRLDRRRARLSRRALDAGGRRPDRDRAHRAGARPLRGLSRRAASPMPSASTATAEAVRRSIMRRASRARRPSARHSAAVSASPGARSRSWAGRSRA